MADRHTMADRGSEDDLRRLEREAEAARARLHETIAEIKDPRTVDNAKLEMKHRAGEVKDQIVDYFKGAKDNALESGRAQGNEFSRKLQRTAIENPLSIALIGAGIGWHLYKKPPITTALIGAGLWQMMKGWDNSPNDAIFRDPYNAAAPRGYVPGGVAGYGYDEVTDVSGATDRVKTIATNLSYGAQSAVAGVQDAISGAAARVRDAVDQGVETLEEANESVTSRVQDFAQDATGAIRGMADEAQRRAEPVVDRLSPWLDAQHRNQLGMVMALGGVGVIAGSWLRGSETGRRWMNEARESWSSAQENARDMSKRAFVEDWRDDASSLRRSAAESAGELRERGAATMRSAQELGAEHPLLISAIGLALGAVLGGMIRQSPLERGSLGAMAGNLRDKAVDALQSNMGHVAEAVVGAVTGDDKNDPAKMAQAQRDHVNA